AGGVEQRVVGHEQVRVRRDPEAAWVYSAAPQALELVDQDGGVDHHPVADHAGLPRVEDPRGDQVELELLAVADDRVAGVVSPLKAHHDVGPLSEQVGELSLPRRATSSIWAGSILYLRTLACMLTPIG